MSLTSSDKAAIMAAGTSSLWGPVLGVINHVLAAISTALTIAFLLWRWHVAIKDRNTIKKCNRGEDPSC